MPWNVTLDEAPLCRRRHIKCARESSRNKSSRVQCSGVLTVADKLSQLNGSAVGSLRGKVTGAESANQRDEPSSPLAASDRTMVHEE